MASLVLSSSMFAQDVSQTGAVSSAASESSGILAQFEQERQALAQQWQVLISQGATQAQVQAWQQQNSAAFALQDQRVEAITLASELQPRPLLEGVYLPANASSTLNNFLTGQAGLANGFAQTYNQFLQGMAADATQEEVNQMQQQFQQAFEQQYAASLEAQQQQAQVLAATAASAPMQVPGPPVIPPNATPQLQAYLILRNALMTSQMQTWNQYITADPEVRQAAMQQWEQQNASQFEQVNQLAQEISNQATNP